jgi:hypothetical protein
VRNSILRRLTRIHKQGTVDTSVMKVHIEDMRMNSTPRLLAIFRTRVANSSIVRPIMYRREWAPFRNPDLAALLHSLKLVFVESAIYDNVRRFEKLMFAFAARGCQSKGLSE